LLIISIAAVSISWKVETVEKAKLVANKPAKTFSAKEYFAEYLQEIYNTAQLSEAGLNLSVFQKAVTGYFNLKASNKVPQYSSVIAIIDFSKSSRTKRMWIVDLISKELLLNTWVAHGNGSGDDMANYFSNTIESHASSLGFYIADDIYKGKHGRSLRLDGMDEGFNDNARARAIVIHAASYVSAKAISRMGRLGRSEGCPAVSPKVAPRVIDIMKGGSVLFISGNDNSYTSKYLDEDAAINYVFPGSSELNASL
jgi:hypothetical protein